MLRFLFGSPFTVPRFLGGLVLLYVLLRGAGHSMGWVWVFWAAIPAGLALGLVVCRMLP